MKGLCNYIDSWVKLHHEANKPVLWAFCAVSRLPMGKPDAVFGTLIRIPSGFALHIRSNTQSYGPIGCTFSTQNHGNNSILARLISVIVVYFIC